MILVDTKLRELEAAGTSVRVGIVGAGFMAQGLVNQILHSVPGMTISVIGNRHADRAHDVLTYGGVDPGSIVSAGSSAAVDAAVGCGAIAITDDMSAVCGAGTVDVVVDCTGAVEFGAGVALDAIANGKHLVLMNAELDATVGTVLVARARAAGVVYTVCDGDQPGVQMNLVRFVQGIGLRPMVCGNVKGLQDPYRNPTTQEGFAKRWGQNPWMVTSFADGTKISVEQAIVANATGMSVHRRGMLGRDHDGHVDELTAMYDIDELEALGGAVDYVVGSKPGPGVFVLATHDDPKQRHYLELYKLGTGPLYSFYTPYHLCHFEVPTTIARAALFGDAALQSLGQPTVEVVSLAKTDLAAGTVLDALGGYHYYGEAEKAAVVASERLVPVGLVEGCTLKRDIPKDGVIGYDDVEVPTGRLADQLRAEQDAMFGVAAG